MQDGLLRLGSSQASGGVKKGGWMMSGRGGRNDKEDELQQK